MTPDERAEREIEMLQAIVDYDNAPAEYPEDDHTQAIECIEKIRDILDRSAQFFAAPETGERELKADFFYDVEDWETSHEELGYCVDGMDWCAVMEVGRLHKMPSIFVANVPHRFDDAGDPDGCEWEEFATEEEALSAIEVAKAKGLAAVRPAPKGEPT